jgi:hypothetical protein
MKTIEENRTYELNDGRLASLRVKQPSKRHNSWPGNVTVIRQWQVFDKGKTVARCCTEAEIRSLELELGELPAFDIIDHATLGLVSAPIKITNSIQKIEKWLEGNSVQDGHRS